MTEGKRPGGLTALAVINFIWGGLTVISALGMLALPSILELAAKEGGADAEKARRDFEQALTNIGPLVWYGLIGLFFVSALLLIVSGIGYLKQKRFLGRVLGSVWAVLSIVSSVAESMLVAEVAGREVGLGVIINLVYPLLTLFLLNVTFKEDFTR